MLFMAGSKVYKREKKAILVFFSHMPKCGPLEINSTHFASFHPHTFIKTHTFMYVSPTLPGMFAPKMCESKK